MRFVCGVKLSPSDSLLLRVCARDTRTRTIIVVNNNYHRAASMTRARARKCTRSHTGCAHNENVTKLCRNAHNRFPICAGLFVYAAITFDWPAWCWPPPRSNARTAVNATVIACAQLCVGRRARASSMSSLVADVGRRRCANGGCSGGRLIYVKARSPERPRAHTYMLSYLSRDMIACVRARCLPIGK